MQHPVRQKVPVGQAGRHETPHDFTPAGQSGATQVPPVPPDPPVAPTPPDPPLLTPPVPPAPPVPGRQSAGSSVLPRQSSQWSQGLLHDPVGVQVGHLVGSFTSASVHVGMSKMLFVPPPGTGTVQQPKQSQPLGVILVQKSMHCWLCCVGQFL